MLSYNRWRVYFFVAGPAEKPKAHCWTQLYYTQVRRPQHTAGGWAKWTGKNRFNKKKISLPLCSVTSLHPSFFSSDILDSLSCNPAFLCKFLFDVSLCCLSLHQLKRVRESEKQCKPLLDKNKLLGKRNDDLTMTIQKLEEKLKSLAKENLEMVSTCHILNVYVFYPLQMARLVCEEMLWS